MSVKCDSLKLEVVFDFGACKCVVTDKERNISDEYLCSAPFAGERTNVQDIDDFNCFVGDCVHAFLDDNNYQVCDEEYYED